MLSWRKEYKRWLTFNHLDVEMKELLVKAKNNESLLEDCFYKNLEFGTAGMRGEIGVGTNRLNIYTVRKAAEGLARFIENKGVIEKHRGVVIAYDSRHKSYEFALETALTLGGHGIKVYIFDALRPTPELSFAIRYLSAFRGVVITASHNPPEYNGFKIYGEDGGQLLPHDVDELLTYMTAIENELTIEIGNQETLLANGQICCIGEEVDVEFIRHLKTVIINSDLVKQYGESVHIVYSPIHGAANVLVQKSLKEVGFNQVSVVREQEYPDPYFSTVASPNPENEDVFELVVKYGQEKRADVLFVTDPDGDRVGVSIRNSEGEFIVLTGNQIGALLLEYLLSQRQKNNRLPKNAVVLKSIVTSELGRKICEEYGVAMQEVLTGFKYIAQKISDFEENEEFYFQMGYEESFGYLVQDFTRDKDAIQAILLISEVAAYYKSKGKILYDGLLEIYEKYGFYCDGQVSLSYKGIEGSKKIRALMKSFRQDIPLTIGDMRVNRMIDYNLGIDCDMYTEKKGRTNLPKSELLKFYAEDGSWFCIRPSGTEPKIKFYFDVVGSTFEESERKLNLIKKDVLKRIDK